MYDEMSNKRRNTEGVVSIMTNPIVMFNVSASFCTARLWCAPNAPAQIGHAAVKHLHMRRERERCFGAALRLPGSSGVHCLQLLSLFSRC